jgi:hypothetical protein
MIFGSGPDSFDYWFSWMLALPITIFILLMGSLGIAFVIGQTPW